MARQEIDCTSEGTVVRGCSSAPGSSGPHLSVALAHGPYVRELAMPGYGEALAAKAPLCQNTSTVKFSDPLLKHDIVPFARRVPGTPAQIIGTERDDMSLGDREISAFHALRTAKDRLHHLLFTVRRTLFSVRTRPESAAGQASACFADAQM